MTRYDDPMGYNSGDNIMNPARHAVTVTPSDTVDLVDGPCRGVYVGVAGNLKVTTFDGDEVVFAGVLAGVIYPIRARRIWAASTATTFLALY